MRPFHHSVGAILAVLLLAPLTHARVPLGFAFTYQGELADAGLRVTGTYDFTFALFSDINAATQVGFTICADNVSVVDGRFTVNLDFAGVFNGQRAYLQISVRPDTGLDCSTTTGFTALAPLQELTATPSALYSMQSGNASTLAGASQSFYLNASNLNAGTLVDSRLSTNVSLLQTPQTFSGPKTFANNNFLLRNSANTFSTTLAASSATTARSITLPDASGTVITTGNLASITGVGTVNTGAWNAQPITLFYGGTSANLSATGGANQLVKQSTVGGPFSVGLLTAAEIPATSGDLSGAYANPSVVRLQGRDIAPTAPSNGQALKWNAAISRWEPAADLDTNTTYTAASGLALTGTAFSIPADAVTSTMLASTVASLSKVSGGVMTATGTRIGINTVPAAGKELHVNGDAQIDGTVTMAAQTRYLTIGGLEFRNLSNTSIAQSHVTDSTSAAGVACSAVVGIHLPQGATITNLEARWNDTSANIATVELWRWSNDPTNGGGTLCSVPSFGNAGPTGTQTSIISSPVVDNSLYYYSLKTEWTTTATGSISLYSVRITYTVTQPLP